MWTERLLKGLDRKKAALIFEPHALDKTTYWNLDVPRVKDTIRTGQLVLIKCEKPNKLCFQKYYGKKTLLVLSLYDIAKASLR